MFLLSPDNEFPGTGIGVTSKIMYRSVFREYKRLLIIKWTDARVQAVVTEMNTFVFGQPGMGGAKSKTGTMAEEDLTAQLDAALAAMDATGLSDDSDANEDNPPSHQDSVPTPPAPDSPLSSDGNLPDEEPVVTTISSINSNMTTDVPARGKGRGRGGRGRGRGRGSGT